MTNQNQTTNTNEEKLSFQCFEHFIEEQKKCEIHPLDLAIQNGIKRAKADRYDKRKIMKFTLTAAAAMLLTILLGTNGQIHQIVYLHYNQNPMIRDENVQMLYDHLKDSSLKYLNQEVNYEINR